MYGRLGIDKGRYRHLRFQVFSPIPGLLVQPPWTLLFVERHVIAIRHFPALGRPYSYDVGDYEARSNQYRTRGRNFPSPLL